MKRTIAETFAALAGRTAFIPYVTGCFPDRETSVEIVAGLVAHGADIVEIGLPFSDPLADGPVIQSAGRLALERGTSPHDVFTCVAKVRQRCECPLVIMTYVNPVLKMGMARFAEQAGQAGVAGVIIPDLPVQEADGWIDLTLKHEIDSIFLVAPNTPEDRARLIASKTRGFLYAVSMAGVTGSDLRLSQSVLTRLRELRSWSSAPVAVGFGISHPLQAKGLKDVADGIIVGSALMRQIMAHQHGEDQIRAAGRFAASIRCALDADVFPPSEDQREAGPGSAHGCRD